MCLKIWVTNEWQGKNKQQKISKKQKGLEYDSLNDSKKTPKTLLKIPVLTTTTENMTMTLLTVLSEVCHRQLSVMTAINTTVPDELWQPRWPTWRRSSSALELVQCSALCAEGKSVTFYSVLTIRLCEQFVGQYSFNLYSRYYLKTKIWMLP